MGNVTRSSAEVQLASAQPEMTGPRGRKPRKALSRRNIMIYGTLIIVSLYYLLPLYVMIVTSLKGMPEIRLGNIFSPPGRDHIPTLGESLVGGLYRS